MSTLSQQNEHLKHLITKEEETNAILRSQNETLKETNEQLKQEISDNKVELAKAKWRNNIMLIVALISCVAAIVSAVFAVKGHQVQHVAPQAVVETESGESIQDNSP